MSAYITNYDCAIYMVYLSKSTHLSLYVYSSLQDIRNTCIPDTAGARSESYSCNNLSVIVIAVLFYCATSRFHCIMYCGHANQSALIATRFHSSKNNKLNILHSSLQLCSLICFRAEPPILCNMLCLICVCGRARELKG